MLSINYILVGNSILIWGSVFLYIYNRNISYNFRLSIHNLIPLEKQLIWEIKGGMLGTNYLLSSAA